MKKWVVANWKMHGSKELLKTYEEKFKNVQNLVVCPPFLYLSECTLSKGGQNVSHNSNGAYTGEVSATMLADVCAKYCIVGHSERRQFFAETDFLVKQKATKCQQEGLIPIICIGESLSDYTGGRTAEIVLKQLADCLPDSSEFWLAYEPLWAIGTGKTPLVTEIAQVHDLLRQRLPGVTLLYGGSVNQDNATEIFAIPNVDGVLVGGASLNVAYMATICDLA